MRRRTIRVGEEDSPGGRERGVFARLGSVRLVATGSGASAVVWCLGSGGHQDCGSGRRRNSIVVHAGRKPRRA